MNVWGSGGGSPPQAGRSRRVWGAAGPAIVELD